VPLSACGEKKAPAGDPPAVPADAVPATAEKSAEEGAEKA